MANYSRGLKLPNRLAIYALILVATVGPLCAEDPFAVYDLAMYDRPSFPVDTQRAVYPSGLKELWLKALERPDADLQRMVVDTIAVAHRRGMEGLIDAQPRLLELLGESNQRLDVLRALVQTLIVLDARDQADALAALALQHGLSITQIVEPSLARWKSPVMQDVWLQRVSEASAGQTMMTLAIDGLGDLESVPATEPLEKILRNTFESLQIRVAAARALGKIHSSGLVDIAQYFVDAPSRPAELNPLFAIELLVRHDDPRAIQLLTDLIRHESTAVQSRSLERLFQIDIDLVDRHASEFISSRDVNVRRWCARAMIGKQNVGRIGMLCPLLDDVNPSLRREVADALVRLAEIPGLHDEILEHTTEVVDRNDWRGCEQAIIVLAKLDHKPSGKRFVELLGHERGEVKVASAWGLTRLRIEQLLPDMLDHAQSVYHGFESRQLNADMPGVTLQVAQLFFAFGDQGYSEADSLMRKYLPKNFSLGFESRAAAAWALGLLYENNPQEDLVAILIERIEDVQGFVPETSGVRRMCAIALGRMKAESALPTLRQFATADNDVGRACYWAIERMTGETPPPPTERSAHEISDWFLAPIRDEGGGM